MDNEILFSLRNIKKSYGNEETLKGISFFVKSGETVAIIGPSGSGKTTLFRIATMLEEADYGTIQYPSGYVTKNNEEEKTVYENKQKLATIKHDFGLVFQNFNLFPHMSVLKNVMDAQVTVYKQDVEKARENAISLLKKVGLESKKDEYPDNLSGGQKQRVAIARALAINPKVLFFDEPTSALDPENTQSVLKLIQELAKEGVTMVIVTHEMEFARNVADKIIFMDDGVIIEEGSPEEVLDNAKNQRTIDFLEKL